jgi:lipopolysaccharide export system permease protein
MIWERYFFKEIAKVFCLFIFAFFLLYTVLDYSAHLQDFLHKSQLPILEIAIYYGAHFIKRTDVLLPVALLVATIKVLSSLNANRELMVLQASGIPLRKLMRPFLVFAGLCVVFNLLSVQFFLPRALNRIDQFSTTHFGYSHRAKRKELSTTYGTPNS